MAAIDHQQVQSGSSGLDSNGNFNIEDKARELFVKACKEVHGHICGGLKTEEFDIRHCSNGQFLCKAPIMKTLSDEPPETLGGVTCYKLHGRQIDQDTKVLEWLRTDDEFNRYFTDLKISGLIKRLSFIAKEGSSIY